MDSKNKLQESKLRLKGAFEVLESKIKKMQNKSMGEADADLLKENSELRSELVQMETTLFSALNKIKNKIVESKKSEMVE